MVTGEPGGLGSSTGPGPYRPVEPPEQQQRNTPPTQLTGSEVPSSTLPQSSAPDAGQKVAKKKSSTFDFIIKRQHSDEAPIKQAIKLFGRQMATLAKFVWNSLGRPWGETKTELKLLPAALEAKLSKEQLETKKQILSEEAFKPKLNLVEAQDTLKMAVIAPGASMIVADSSIPGQMYAVIKQPDKTVKTFIMSLNEDGTIAGRDLTEHTDLHAEDLDDFKVKVGLSSIRQEHFTVFEEFQEGWKRGKLEREGFQSRGASRPTTMEKIGKELEGAKAKAGDTLGDAKDLLSDTKDTVGGKIGELINKGRDKIAETKRHLDFARHGPKGTNEENESLLTDEERENSLADREAAEGFESELEDEGSVDARSLDESSFDERSFEDESIDHDMMPNPQLWEKTTDELKSQAQDIDPSHVRERLKDLTINRFIITKATRSSGVHGNEFTVYSISLNYLTKAKERDAITLDILINPDGTLDAVDSVGHSSQYKSKTIDDLAQKLREELES